MTFGIYGYTDKRPVLYALMHLLQNLGDVAVVTPNRHLTRLISDHSDMGHIGNTFICITDLSPDEVWEYLQHNPDDFSHVIYDLQDSVVDVDLAIYILGSEYEDGEKDFLECLPQEPVVIKLMYDGKPAKEPAAYNVAIGPEYLGLVEYIERNKILKPINNKQLSKALAKTLSKGLEISEKSLLSVLAGRRN